MWKVIKDIDGDKTEYTFETAWEAVKFVSEGYCYFDYKYIRTEKFNCATTEKVIPSERPDDYEYSDDYYCEPFDEELRWAYVDCWDATISWEISPILKRYSTKFEVEYYAYAENETEAKKIAIENFKDDLKTSDSILDNYSETREISENE